MFRVIVLKSTLLLFIALSIACDKKNASNVPLQSLSVEQNQSLKDFTKSLNGLGDVYNKVDGQNSQTGDPNTQAVVDGVIIDCTTSEPTESSYDLVSSVDGPNCPILMKLELSVFTEPSAGSVSLDLDFNYKLLNTSFYKYSDIIAASFNGEISATIKDDMVTGGGNFSGVLTSQKYGDVSVALNIDYNDSPASIAETTTMTITLRFSNFVAVGSIVSKGQEDPVYTINGIAVSKDEFKENFSGLFSSNLGV